MNRDREGVSGQRRENRSKQVGRENARGLMRGWGKWHVEGLVLMEMEMEKEKYETVLEQVIAV